MTETDNNIEIKLISDYREFFLSKIEYLKDSLNQVASSFGNDISSSIDEFSKRIHNKLKIIEERFTKNSEELETLKVELRSRKFDETNFNNVSIIRTLDKTIKERDLKIKELENRIRYIEKKETDTHDKLDVSKESILDVPVEVPDEKTINIQHTQSGEDVVVAVSTKKVRPKTDKKKSELSNIEDKLNKPIRKIKKNNKVDNEEHAISNPTLITQPELSHVSIADLQALATETTNAEDEERISEEQRTINENAVRVIEEDRVAKAESERIKNKSVGKKSNTSKNNTTTNALKKSISKPIDSIPMPINIKETQKIKHSYPDKLPELIDLDVITVNKNDYYCDKNNQGVYQIINSDDIGAFLGYYDLQTETIMPVE